MTDSAEFMLNLNKISSDEKLPTFLRKAATEVQASGYLTAGDYFEKLEDVEVLQLAVMMNTVRPIDNSAYRTETPEAAIYLYLLSLLCYVLALGEGTVELDPSELNEALHSLFIVIAVENLYRRGEVQVFRENFSVLESFRPIARVIKGKSDEDTKRT